MSYLSAASADSATKKETVFFLKTEVCVQKKAKENGDGGMSTFGDGGESSGLVCTKDVVGAIMIGVHEKYWKILNVF